MPNPDALVSTVVRLDPPLDRPAAERAVVEGDLAVELEGERRVRLDAGDPRSAGFAQVLDGLRRERLPVYLEVDPETSALSRLLIPHVTRVVGIEPTEDGDLDVEIEMSHARHLLRHSAPDFEELERHLRQALRTGDPVVLTENDAHEILDVRGHRPGGRALEGPPAPFPRRQTLPQRSALRRWIEWLQRLWRWWRFRGVSETRAQQAFDAVAATSCDPLTVPRPCIPFLYPDDGCWGRAHEMVRLMLDMGLKPRKVWIEGGLQVSTRNNPTCGVEWKWHVAPTVRVSGPGFLETREVVFDPSLFTAPVSRETWKGVQGDPNATFTDSGGEVFYLRGGAVTDPTYEQTNFVLATYRLQLLRRALRHGPPPYADCP